MERAVTGRSTERSLRRNVVRYGAYPATMGTALAVTGAVLAALLPPWCLAASVVAGLGVVALLERRQPYLAAWNRDHDDAATDALHALANFGLLAAVAVALHVLRSAVPTPSVWPTAWPVLVQLFAAGLVIDLGLYVMHRVSHRYPWAWRLHAIHHSAERLYWLNGERRHPLSAVLMAGPGLLVVVALGAPALLVSAWLSLLAIQLGFQHANVDYRVGPLRRWLGVAEVHRWHHKRDYEDSQVNFGEFFMIWDRLFGTFLDRPESIEAGDVGLRERNLPAGYLAQLRWPFTYAPVSDPARAAFEDALAAGAAALRCRKFPRAYALIERAHVLGQSRTVLHVRSHLAFLRYAWHTRDGREAIGQFARLAAAAVMTRIWIPRGNTGGARVSAFRPMPVPADVAALLEAHSP